jgi:hypothetical protein
MKTMLEPRMAAAITQPPLAGNDSPQGFARITASSQGGLAMFPIIQSHQDLSIHPFGHRDILL